MDMGHVEINIMIYLLEFVDLIRVLLGMFCGFFIGVWFSLNVSQWTEHSPYKIVERTTYENPRHDADTGPYTPRRTPTPKYH